MRILIAVDGTRGDVHPMLELGRTLQANGHMVRLCAPPDFAAPARLAGIEIWPMGESVQMVLTDMADALHGSSSRFMVEVERYGRRNLEIQIEVLPEAARGMDCVIGAGPVLAAASAAELHRIPYHFVAYTPTLLPSVEHSPALTPMQLRSRTSNRVLWWIVRKGFLGLMARRLREPRRRLGLPRITDAYRHLLGERPIVAADAHLAPLPSDLAPHCTQIRCLHPTDGDPLPPKLEAFLDTGPPPVYLGFGSMTDPDPVETTRRLLTAIEALGCRALISRGWAGLGDVPLPEGVLGIDGVSHASLFPRLAAVVHHGGAGTTHTAARAGVPQIILPHVLDQFYFARRVAELGIGPPGIPRRKLRVESLIEALRATLDAEIMTERARELGERLASLGPVDFDPRLLVRE
jgi:UDP:flavonoid glycosyltransferase YjiC (YdhE family)